MIDLKKFVERSSRQFDTLVRTQNAFSFGDIIENGYASDDNPHKLGIFLRYSKCRNALTIYLTNGNGSFWHTMDDNHSKNKTVGSILSF